MIYEPNQCPIWFALGIFGDRWPLLIIRDLMFRGSTRFQDFLDAGEGISTNVLPDRLSRLETRRIISREKDPANGRQVDVVRPARRRRFGSPRCQLRLIQ